MVRKYSYPLRDGRPVAYLCTEVTSFNFLDSLDSPRLWFKSNVDTILREYGAHHPIQKEDLNFGGWKFDVTSFGILTNHPVIGTLDTPNYALFVSHKHRRGLVGLFPSFEAELS